MDRRFKFVTLAAKKTRKRIGSIDFVYTLTEKAKTNAKELSFIRLSNLFKKPALSKFPPKELRNDSEGYYDPINRVRRAIRQNATETEVGHFADIIGKRYPMNARNIYSSYWFNPARQNMLETELSKNDSAPSKDDLKLKKFMRLCNNAYRNQNLPEDFITKSMSRRKINNLSVYAIPRLAEDLNDEFNNRRDLCRSCFCIKDPNLLADCDCNCHEDYNDDNLDADEGASAKDLDNYSIHSQTFRGTGNFRDNSLHIIKSEEEDSKNLKIRVTVTKRTPETMPIDDDVNELDFLARLSVDKAKSKKKKLDTVFKSMADDEKRKKELELVKKRDEEDRLRKQQLEMREKQNVDVNRNDDKIHRSRNGFRQSNTQIDEEETPQLAKNNSTPKVERLTVPTHSGGSLFRNALKAQSLLKRNDSNLSSQFSLRDEQEQDVIAGFNHTHKVFDKHQYNFNSSFSNK